MFQSSRLSSASVYSPLFVILSTTVSFLNVEDCMQWKLLVGWVHGCLSFHKKTINQLTAKLYFRSALYLKRIAYVWGETGITRSLISDYNIYLAFHQPNLRKTGVEHERWVIIAATRTQFPFLAVIFVFILLFLFLVFFTLDGAAIGVGFYSNFASTFRTTLFTANLKWITRNLRFGSYTVNSISPQRLWTVSSKT